VLSEIGRDLDERLSSVLRSFPGFLRVLWLCGFWTAVGWSIALLVIAAFRHRPHLTLEGSGAAVLAMVIAVIAAAIVAGRPGDVLTRLGDTDGPPVFPPAVLAMTSAVISVMAPYLTLPFRRFGRAIMAAQVVGALFLGAALALGSVVALAIGLLVGTFIHLLRGSPGGFPTVTRVRDALRDLGVEVHEVVPTAMRREGVALLAGTPGRVSCSPASGARCGTEAVSGARA
jgi:hypothetical protein